MFDYQVKVNSKEEFDTLAFLAVKAGFRSSKINWDTFSRYSYICLDMREKYFSGNSIHKESGGKLISLEDCLIAIINIPWVKPPTTIDLNKNYKAVVSERGVEVGCQNFSHAKIFELAEICKEYIKPPEPLETKEETSIIEGDVD